jgi:hypothetical protein
VEQQRADDRAAAVSVGEEFGLGEVRSITLARSYPPSTGLGVAVAGLSVFGIPGVVLTAGWAQAVNAAAFGTLFLLGCLMFGLGVAGGEVSARLYRYSGGLAEFAGDSPEPRVVRWADVEAVTVTYGAGGQPTGREPVLTGCVVRAADGTELPGAAMRYERIVLRAVAAEASRVLAPRLTAPQIEDYEAGRPVTVGGTRIDRSGITFDLPRGTPIPWGEVGSITISYATSPTGPAVVTDIAIARRSGGPDRVIGLSGVPNGVFLPRLIARAAAAHGVPVRSSPRGLRELEHIG